MTLPRRIVIKSKRRFSSRSWEGVHCASLPISSLLTHLLLSTWNLPRFWRATETCVYLFKWVGSNFIWDAIFRCAGDPCDTSDGLWRVPVCKTPDLLAISLTLKLVFLCSLDRYLSVEWPDHRVVLFLVLGRNCHIVFHRGWTSQFSFLPVVSEAAFFSTPRPTLSSVLFVIGYSHWGCLLFGLSLLKVLLRHVVTTVIFMVGQLESRWV